MSIPTKKRLVQVSYSLRVQIINSVKALADIDGVSASSIIREVIEDHVKSRYDGLSARNKTKFNKLLKD